MQIYYYTRTGRSEAVAKALAEKYNIEANQITDNINFDGLLGFLKGGAKAAKKEKIEVKYKEVNQEDELVLVFPIWAGTYPPAVNSFLENRDRAKITLIPTSLVSTLKDRENYKKIIDLVGKEIMEINIEL